MSFNRVRKIGNGYYLYEEHRWREDGKVKSKSIFLSVVGGILDALVPSPSSSSAPPATEVDRSVVGHASEVDDMAQGAAELASREAAKEAPAADAAPDADAGKDGGDDGSDAEGSE